jgi:hypothetical protein
MDEKRPHNGVKTRCNHGHEFTPENTISRADGRECRECKNARQRSGYVPPSAELIARPSDVDLAWSAGFLDGEGCFTLSINTGKQDWNRRPIMNACQIRILPIAKLESLFGGVVRNPRSDRTSTGDHFQWQLSTKSMVVVIPWLLPYLTVKKEEAELVLAYAKTVKRSRPGTRCLSEDEIAYRQTLVDRLREMRS